MKVCCLHYCIYMFSNQKIIKSIHRKRDIVAMDIATYCTLIADWRTLLLFFSLPFCSQYVQVYVSLLETHSPNYFHYLY